MIRRLRLLMPPDYAIVGYAFAYLLSNLPILIAWQAGFPPAPQMTYLRRFLYAIGLVAYGAYRVFAFHPFYLAEYRRWLEMTPWRWPKPLPVGPPHLVWEDAVIFLAASAPEWALGDVDPTVSLALLLGGYLAAIGPTFFTTGAWALGYATLFGLALAVRLWSVPTFAAGAAVATYLVAMIGLRRSLRRWPWGLPVQSGISLTAQTQETNDRRLGWPHDQLSPKFPDRFASVRMRDGILGSLLGGWAFYAFESLFVNPAARLAFSLMVSLYVMTGLVMFRLARYLSGYASPINLWGRIATLRWIIPAYDQVLVTPAVAAATMSLGPLALRQAGLPWDLAVPISFSLALMAVLIGGPSLRQWRLTGRHRIAPVIKKATGQMIQVG